MTPEEMYDQNEFELEFALYVQAKKRMSYTPQMEYEIIESERTHMNGSELR